MKIKTTILLFFFSFMGSVYAQYTINGVERMTGNASYTLSGVPSGSTVVWQISNTAEFRIVSSGTQSVTIQPLAYDKSCTLTANITTSGVTTKTTKTIKSAALEILGDSEIETTGTFKVNYLLSGWNVWWILTSGAFTATFSGNDIIVGSLLYYSGTVIKANVSNASTGAYYEVSRIINSKQLEITQTKLSNGQIKCAVNYIPVNSTLTWSHNVNNAIISSNNEITVNTSGIAAPWVKATIEARGGTYCHAETYIMQLDLSGNYSYKLASNPVNDVLEIVQEPLSYEADAERLSVKEPLSVILYNDFGVVKMLDSDTEQESLQIETYDVPNGTYYLNIVKSGEIIDRKVIFIKH